MPLNIDELMESSISDIIPCLTAWDMSQFDAKTEAERTTIHAVIAYKLTNTFNSKHIILADILCSMILSITSLSMLSRYL